MGHNITSIANICFGECLLKQSRAGFFSKTGNKFDVVENRKTGRRSFLRLWSGLSESNRHLDLGKSAGSMVWDSRFFPCVVEPGVQDYAQ
jgi:hypothetical protein